MEHPASSARRWWILAVVIAGQFMFVVDAFIVNVAIPSIRADLQASGGAMEAVIAIYQVAFATLVITGGRLGDMYGRKRLFLLGLMGFTVASIACGLATSAAMLIAARLAQGAAAAMMSPQVLATIHTLFPDGARSRAFAVFGVALGLGGATGFWLGGWLIALDVAGLGWRSVFFVNGPVGVALMLAAGILMPVEKERRLGTLDWAGATVLFVGLLCLIGPVLAARDEGYAWWLWIIEAIGAALLIAFCASNDGSSRPDGCRLSISICWRIRVSDWESQLRPAFSSPIFPSIWLSHCFSRAVWGGLRWTPAAVSCRWRSRSSLPHDMAPAARPR